MINGYVINNLGKGKHRFKRSVFPGMKISLEELYQQYSKSYGGKFDIGFLKWLEETKVPKGCGFDIVVEEIVESESPEEDVKLESPVEEKLPIPNQMTAKQIATLKIKDKPKVTIQQIMSKHKLRRALTMCKGRPGKEMLTKLIRERMVEIK